MSKSVFYSARRAIVGRALLLISLTAVSCADVVINELMYHPQHAENSVEPFAEEFIELHNTDPANPVAVGGWSFSSGVSYVLPDLEIPANGYLVVSADPVAFAVKYPEVTAMVVGPFSGHLGNDGERIRLVDVAGAEVDELTYTDDGDWSQRRRGPLDRGHQGWMWESLADGGGSSLELIQSGISNKRGQNWSDSQNQGGSPGAANSVASADLAPMISKVSHHPAVPSSGDLVLIRAELVDELPASDLVAQVHYRVSSDTPGPFTALAMFDDGLSDDGLPNDGLFGAKLPAHADGTVVEFYIEASDGANSRTWPSPTDELGGQEANALYVVEDGALVSSQEVYRLVLSVEEDDEFADGNFNAASNAQMNASFIATRGGSSEIRYCGGLRRRGNGSRDDDPRTMRLNLPAEEAWDDVTSLNLNARYGYLQLFGQRLFAASGLAAQRGRPIKLLMNGDDQADGSDLMYGFYVHMEPQNKLSTERLFPDDSNGNLYKKRRPSTDLAYQSGDVDAYLDDGWTKGTNRSEWDWSDLDALLGALNDTDSPDYYTQLAENVDIEQWLRWFAVMALLNNGETNISNGTDDDYYIYRGVTDPRFKLIPHDLDTILGLGDSSAISDPENTVFDMFERSSVIPILEDFIKHPEILHRYFFHLNDLVQTSFSKESFDSLVADCISYIPASQRAEIIEHMDERRAYVRSVVNPVLVVESGLPVDNGFPKTDADVLDLGGSYNLTNTVSILVNGQPADLDPSEGDWSFGPVVGGLLPGINRILVQAYDAGGDETGREFFEIWYDDGDVETLSGELAVGLVLSAATGPYLVSDDLTVPVGVTLSIEPGTSVYFASGTRLTVEGTLLAEGTLFQPIQFTRDPNGTSAWDGVYFSDSDTENRMTHLDQGFSTSASQSVDVDDSRLTATHVRWLDTTETVIEVSHPRLLLFDCEFPPTSGNEVIHGNNLSGDDFFHLDGCFFNSSSGYNDIIDFSGGRRPGPIIYVTNCIFNGGTDDCLDLDGIDAHVEGNIFRNIHTDDPSRSSTSNAIATDGNAHITIVRNVFDNVDHALLLKNDADAIFENNVVVNATLGAISFREPLRPDVDAGSHVDVRGNIFYNNAVTFRFPDHLQEDGDPPLITADGNIMPAADHVYGSDNLDADPGFMDPAGGDYRLLPTSPARGTGIQGNDMGYDVLAGALLSGAPPERTSSDSATIRVHIAGVSGIDSGSFVSEYRWRLNGGTWSVDTSIAMPIELIDLIDGSYTVEVVAKNSAGFWQSVLDAASVSWMVDSLSGGLLINEVLADNRGIFDNGGTFPDYIELINDGLTAIDLGGMGLTDDPEVPGKYIFPAITIGAGERLLLIADSETALPGMHLGFGLDSEGDSVTLFAVDGVTVIGSVSFGPQIPDHSIGRVGRAGEWLLNVPTPNVANRFAGTGSPAKLRINEWLAGSSIRFCDDFVELYNPGSSPVALGGLYLTDDPGVNKGRYQVPPLSFIAAGGFETFWADGKPSLGADHLNFKLNANAEWVGLYAADLSAIDLVAFTAEATDVSHGRLPDGGNVVASYFLPTPGLTNYQSSPPTTETQSLIAIDDVWSYEQSDTDLLTAWREPEYDDSLWPTGAALLYVESSSLPGPKNTELTLGSSTYYFRRSFEFSGDPMAAELTLQTVIDDSVVIYLNGVELHRARIDDSYDHGTYTGSDYDAVGDADLEGPFEVPSGALVEGINVIAAEVHQVNSGSSDVVFGLTLDASIEIPGQADPAYQNALDLLAGLRVTEIMYDPIDGGEFEFIELQNIGGKALDLTGVRISDGVAFVFPAWTLEPGGYVLVVKNQAAFESKYGTGFPIAGSYTGSLSNGGEEIAIQLPDPFSANIQKFSYNNTWYPLTDGAGHSLEFAEPSASIDAWDDPAAWRVGVYQGTPGGAVFLLAGGDQEVVLPAEVSLAGTISGAWSPTLEWRTISGPGGVSFSDSTAIDSAASFSLPGTYELQLTGSDEGFSLSDSVVVTVYDTYDAWRQRLGVAGGPVANDDGDEFFNFEEYAFEFDPFGFDLVRPLVLAGNGGVITVEFLSYPLKSDVMVELETSPGILNWEPITPDFVSGTPDQQLLRHTVPSDSHPQGFFRLKVSEVVD